MIGGGDDHIVKSATAAEVVARVHAVLRRTRRGRPDADAGVLDFGRLVLDTRRHEVRVAGRPVPLAVREFALFETVHRPEHVPPVLRQMLDQGRLDRWPARGQLSKDVVVRLIDAPA